MYHNIPLELREYNQWVCWRYENAGGRKTKVPYCPSPHNPAHASVHNPNTWGSFNDAVQAANSPTMDGIGFVLTENDPFTGIDIDDKLENPASEQEKAVHQRILQQFDSYTERSVGGRGYHIIIRGKIVGGRDRGHVGVYSTARYLTFSGDVVRNAPIAEYQELLTLLAAQMPDPGYAGELDEVEGHLTDVELHEMALRAANGDKYAQLTRGEWKEMGYPSASEADLALVSIYAYYTRDNEQVRRMFRYTILGKREKHTSSNRWIDRCLQVARKKQPREVDYEQARQAAAAFQKDFDAREVSEVSAPSETAVTSQTSPEPANNAPAPTRARGEPYTLPPGLVGEMARYFYSTAQRPLHEAALISAIGLASGVAGRAYNISGTGLNQYLLFVAGTGKGKDGISDGIHRLLFATRQYVPMIDDFIGPSAFASGQGLIRVLDSRPCFVSLLGEFGLTLQALSDPRAPAAIAVLRKILLDLYNKSGWNQMLGATAYSDQEKNTKTVHAPSVTILAESTPETFYDKIDLSDIADGLIPRFQVIEYTGKRQPRNRNAGSPPPQSLVSAFANLCSAALTSQSNNTCSAVQTTGDALALLDAFDIMADAKINNGAHSSEAQLWNRAHLKALKLAGVIAVGVKIGRAHV